jgi:hypothetical protein
VGCKRREMGLLVWPSMRGGGWYQFRLIWREWRMIDGYFWWVYRRNCWQCCLLKVTARGKIGEAMFKPCSGWWCGEGGS